MSLPDLWYRGSRNEAVTAADLDEFGFGDDLDDDLDGWRPARRHRHQFTAPPPPSHRPAVEPAAWGTARTCTCACVCALEVARMTQLRSEGFTVDQVAGLLGRSPATVRRHLPPQPH